MAEVGTVTGSSARVALAGVAAGVTGFARARGAGCVLGWAAALGVGGALGFGARAVGGFSAAGIPVGAAPRPLVSW